MESYVTKPFSHHSANLVIPSQSVTPTFNCLLSSLTSHSDPTSFKQAVQDMNWVKAMNVELDVLEANDTWKMTSLPPDKKAIGCKWLYKTKFGSDGSIERFKSRLVILVVNKFMVLSMNTPLPPSLK